GVIDGLVGGDPPVRPLLPAFVMEGGLLSVGTREDLRLLHDLGLRGHFLVAVEDFVLLYRIYRVGGGVAPGNSGAFGGLGDLGRDPVSLKVVGDQLAAGPLECARSEV